MNTADLILCDAYKSATSEETYLFVDHNDGLQRLPEALQETFSDAVLVTRFKLTADRKMARADAKVVMQAIREQGFYLQMPPPKDHQLAAMSAKNDKLQR